MLVLNLLCKDHKMLGWRKKLIHEKAFLPWMLNDKPVLCNVIFPSGIMWILCGNSSFIHVVHDLIGSWHQVFSEAGCSRGSVRLIQQWQKENW